jgi:hypothetical protein
MALNGEIQIYNKLMDAQGGMVLSKYFSFITPKIELILGVSTILLLVYLPDLFPGIKWMTRLIVLAVNFALWIIVSIFLSSKPRGFLKSLYFYSLNHGEYGVEREKFRDFKDLMKQ